MLEALRRLHRGIDLDADLPVPMVTLEALYARRLVYAPPPGYRHDFMLTPAGVSMVLETDHVRLQSMYLDGSDTFSTFGKHIRVTDLIAWRIFRSSWRKSAPWRFKKG
jgi:hypothetical protein